MDWNREEKIRKRALEIWENEGKPEGLDRDHWERAEREVDGREVDGVKNPVGNGQGDAQSDDPNNDMNE